MTTYDDVRVLATGWVARRADDALILGVIGRYNDAGTSWEVDVEDDPGMCYVTLLVENEPASSTKAINTRVTRMPQTVVRLRRNSSDQLEVIEVDFKKTRELYGAYAGGLNVPEHNHRRGVMPFQIEPELFEAGGVFPTDTSSLNVRIYGRFYVADTGVLSYYPGEQTIDLTDYLPSTSGKHHWIILAINNATGGTAVIEGAEIDTALDLTDNDLASVAPDLADYTPLRGVKLTYGQTTFTDYTDFRYVETGGVGYAVGAILKTPPGGTSNTINAQDGYSSLVVRGVNGGSFPNYPYFRIQLGATDVGATQLMSVYQSGDIEFPSLYYDLSATAWGFGTTSPSSKTILDVVSTTKGARPYPAMTETERDAISGLGASHKGLSVFNTDTSKLNLWDGAAWTEVSVGVGSIAVEEADGSPSVTATTLKFPDASLTDETGGVVRYRVQQQLVFAVAGDLTVAGQPFRISNNFGRTLTIKGVYLNVNTSPTGASILVDVNKNGTTIFTTQANRPAIAASANSGSSTTIDVTSWAVSDYLTMDVDQIGSTIAGANLTVHVWVEG